ncbi:MAG TPA: hypothetical protein VED59_00710, partial [Acidimicrobiales bacterium]|nr:hypothetical protein [Acidimicrobiales bacterium]
MSAVDNSKRPKKLWRLTPASAHEWVCFEDPLEQREWRFDATFLLSRWHCLYGHGCQGVLTEKSPKLEEGCCSYGAHFTGEEDEARITAAAASLTPEQWQYSQRGRNG